MRLCLQKGKRFKGEKVPTERSLIFKSQNFRVEKKNLELFFLFGWLFVCLGVFLFLFFFNLDNN